MSILGIDISSVLTSTLLGAAFPYNPGFDIRSVANMAVSLPSHSWEYGAATMALLELYNPENSVFGDAPFPVPTIATPTNFAMLKGKEWIVIGEGKDGLSDGDGAAGDPASLGVIAWMIGKTDQEYADATTGEVIYLTEQAPRWVNGSGAGAISQRADVAELWSDFMYMVPPFLAFYAADQGNETLLHESYKQCEYQRAVLKANETYYGSEPFYGIWHHIIGPQSQDLGLWSTGNGWAAGGMVRVLATILKAPVAQSATWKDQAITDLTTWLKEIIDGVMGSPLKNGMVHNYMDVDGSIEAGRLYPEFAGSLMISNVIYRLAVLQPETFGASYIKWADDVRTTLGGSDPAGYKHVSTNGTVAPTVDPLNWFAQEPFTAGSPEANGFAVMMYSAWRDCIKAEKCTYEGTYGDFDIEVEASVNVTLKRSHRRMHHLRRFETSF